MNSPVRSQRTSRHTALAAVCLAGAVFASAAGAELASSAPAFAATAPSGPTAPASSPSTATAANVQSVMMVPTNTTPNDPDGGQWFYFSLKPGQSAASAAKITNPASVPQTVYLSMADLLFTKDGTPYINKGTQTDVGSWAHFDVPSVTIPPDTSIDVPFQVKAAGNAEPGDHFGVVVATSQPEKVGRSKALDVVKIVAVRMFITIPGVATKSFQIGSITSKLDSALLPHRATVSVVVRNTGRIRLDPKVSIGGVKATGSPVLLAESSQLYTAKVHVPLYGGPVNEDVVVTTNYAGLSKKVGHSQFVFPFAVIAFLLLLGLAGFGVAMLIRRRVRKQRRLRADLRRLEQMVLSRPGLAPGPPHEVAATDAGDAPPGDRDGDGDGPATLTSASVNSAAVSAMESAIKRARRSGHTETLPELAIALHEAGGDALDALLESVPLANGRTPKVLNALAAYPAERIQASPRLAKLSASDRTRLVSKGTGAVGEFGAGPRGKTKAGGPGAAGRVPRQPVR